MGWASAVLIVARGVHLTGVLLAFGAMVFRQAIVPSVPAQVDPNSSRVFGKHSTRFILASLAVALIGGCIWLPFQAGEMTGAGDAIDTLRHIPVVLFNS